MPARATTLYSVEVPSVGGDTLFADQYAAYDALPKSTKRLIEPLYAVSRSSLGIVGMPQDEAVALRDELAAHVTQTRFVYSLRYGVGDVVVWDNASLLHAATLTDPEDPRTLWRVTLKERAAPAAAVLASTFTTVAL